MQVCAKRTNFLMIRTRGNKDGRDIKAEDQRHLGNLATMVQAKQLASDLLIVVRCYTSIFPEVWTSATNQ